MFVEDYGDSIYLFRGPFGCDEYDIIPAETKLNIEDFTGETMAYAVKGDWMFALVVQQVSSDIFKVIIDDFERDPTCLTCGDIKFDSDPLKYINDKTIKLVIKKGSVIMEELQLDLIGASLGLYIRYMKNACPVCSEKILAKLKRQEFPV